MFVQPNRIFIVVHMDKNRILRTWMRPLVWLARFPYRRGYGVHSPFAFNFITQVIYQRTPYYKYEELAKQERREAPHRPREWRYESRKVKRLLFRLVNEARPHSILDAGRLAASALYLQAARVNATYTSAASLDELFLETDVPMDFLYLHDYRRPDFMAQVFRLCVPRTHTRSLFVIEGICYSKAMRQLWEEMKRDDRVAVTFDLYDLGILLFDTDKNKQHYVVNF